MTALPDLTPEFLAAKRPLSKRWAEQRAPFWDRFMNGEIDHPTYCDLTRKFFNEYATAIKPAFEKAVEVANARLKGKT